MNVTELFKQKDTKLNTEIEDYVQSNVCMKRQIGIINQIEKLISSRNKYEEEKERIKEENAFKKEFSGEEILKIKEILSLI